MANSNPQRVIAYIDGFNLYHGLRDSGFRRFLWLDLHKMATRLLAPGQQLLGVKYFTARIIGGRPGDPPNCAAERNEKRRRQSLFLDALGTIPEITTFYGHYLEKPKKCNKCGYQWMNAEEKMTDVRIATELLVDAFANHFDTAIIVSADSDLVPPIDAIRRCKLGKRINVAFPPGRSSANLKQAADGQCVIHKTTLRKSQLPEEIKLPNGYTLKKPAKWS